MAKPIGYLSLTKSGKGIIIKANGKVYFANLNQVILTILGKRSFAPIVATETKPTKNQVDLRRQLVEKLV